jgi:hypothetical protein
MKFLDGKIMKINRRAIAVPLLSCLVLAVSGALTVAQAQDHRARERERARFDTAHWRWDGRYNHNHYYPSIGYALPSLPPGRREILFGWERYYYNGGAWFRFNSGRYVVIRPPLGIVLPVLPDGYSTVWSGNVPYYYADDVYYTQTQQGYAVAEPPPDVVAQMQDQAPGQAYGAPPAPPPQYGAAPPPQVPGMWYYCDSAQAYYPTASTCSQPWRPVPATPPPR